MKKSHRENKILSSTYVGIGIVLVFFIWWLYSFVLVKQGNSPYLFPDPWIVVKTFGANFLSQKVWNAFGWTMLRLVVGFAVSFLFASILGILGALFDPIRLILKPFVLIMKTVPTAAVVFMILILAGTNWTPCYLVFLVVFPIVYESFLQGIDSIDDEIKDALRLETKFYNPRSVFGILLPNASPYVLLSIVTSLGLALKVSIMAEIVAGGSSLAGLGRLIYVANSIELDMAQVMALSVLAILAIAIVDVALFFVKKAMKKKDLIS